MRTGLSRPAVSAIIRRLELAQLVQQVGTRTGRRGRKPVAYGVHEQTGFVVGVDIGAQNLRVAAADLFGGVIAETAEPTATNGAGKLSDQITTNLQKLISGLERRRHHRPLAIGISTPGIVNQASRRVTGLAHNVSPSGDLGSLEIVGERFRAPVLIDNDVNLAAEGERWAGIARGVSSFVFVSVGVGVGMGIVINDELVRGAHGTAGEIGYLPSSADPFDESHRLHGGLEDEIGAAGILAAMQRTGCGDKDPQTAQEVFELAWQGYPGARSVVDEAARRLGTAIATVCAVLDPDLVVLGGGIGSNRILIAPVRSTVAALVPVTPPIDSSALGNRATLYGALAIALRQARDEVLSLRLRHGAETIP